MIKTSILLFMFVVLLSCKKTDFTENLFKKEMKYNSPYQAFLETLEPGKLTDTILVQTETQVFGCGTAAYEYFEELKKTGLDKFYKKHKTVLTDTALITKFERKHKLKILWVTRGFSGEKMELLNSVLHKNIEIEKRLWATKNFIKFTETPKTLNDVTVFYSIVYPKEKKYLTKEYQVSQVNKNWESIKKSTEKSEIKDFRFAYYPF